MKADLAALEAGLAAVPPGPEHARDRIDALTRLAWEIRGEQVRRANELAAEARELAIEVGDKLGQARAARILGMTRGPATTDLKQHVAYGEESRRLFDEVGDLAGGAGARDFLASIHEFLGNHALAMELAEEAYELARRARDPVRQGFALANVGNILATTGDRKGGLERLHEALGHFESAGHDHGIGRICSLLSGVYLSDGDHDGALNYARKGYDVALRAGVVMEQAAALQALGDLQRDLGQAEEAEDSYRQGLALMVEDDARYVIGLSAIVSLAGLLLARGETGEARQLLQDCADGVTEFGITAPAEMARVHQALADVAEAAGDLTAAVEHLRQVNALRGQAAEKDLERRLEQVTARAEIKAARQEAEIHRLRYVELRDMQSKLVQAEKMAQLGALAAGTAHELNTPLGVLHSNLDVSSTVFDRLFAMVPAAPEPRVDRLRSAVESCRQTTRSALERIATVADSFRRFSHLDLAERTTFDVAAEVRSTLAVVRPSLPPGVFLTDDLADVAPVDGWPSELNQAFLTVIKNAVEAIDDEGTVAVAVRADGTDVVVAVRDTGRGLDEDGRHRLFDVGWSATGQRTKMRLGLPAAQATVQRHGGSLDVVETSPRGTTIEFRLPAAPA